MLITRKHLCCAAAVALLVCAPAALARRANPPAGRTGSPASGGSSCMQCHGSATGAGAVEILGLPGSYQAGAVYDLTIRVSDPDQVGAGFQISIENAMGTHVGILSLIDPTTTQLNGSDPNFVNHTSAGVVDSVAGWAGLGDAAEYPVRWQAPATDAGPITFWAAGNAINNNFSSSGDIIYLTDQTIAAAQPGDCTEDGVVDLADYLVFEQCVTGPDNGPVMEDCSCADLNEDDDVDLADFAAFQVEFSDGAP